MTQFVAFLRGINVGGRNLLKMQDVRQGFIDLGLRDVLSYKASGNILFETDESPDKVTTWIRERLHEISQRDIEVFLRSFPEIVEILKIAPFEGRNADPSKLYVTFLPFELSLDNTTNLWTHNRDLEIIQVIGSEVYSQTYLYKDRYGAPNKFIEDFFNIISTTRNWNTVKGVYKRLTQ